MKTEEGDTGRVQMAALPTMDSAFDHDRSTLQSSSEKSIGAKSELPPDAEASIRGAEDIVTKVLHVEDDPSLSSCTFRMWFIGEYVLNSCSIVTCMLTSLGIGLGIFGAIMETIYFFRPVTLDVSNIFLALCAYGIGILMEKVIPRKGVIGCWLNPHAFNSKEHAAIIIVATSASQVSMAVEVIAVQRLYYDKAPSSGLSILIVLASQCLGYGFAGLLRRTLVYSTKMFWPSLLPMNTLLETLHRDRKETKSRLSLFYWVFLGIFIWEVLPEYIMPILTGVSVFCLASQNSLFTTTIFGGSNGNEGLGILSLGLDWQFIGSKPLWLPPQTLMNSFAGYIICIALFLGVYYGNVWRARDFPFLSQLLFSEDSTGSNYVTYNQTAILDDQHVLQPESLKEQGIPFFAGTYAMFLLTNNLAITSTISHLLLWNWDDMKAGYAFLHPSNLRKAFEMKSWKSLSRRSQSKTDSTDEQDEGGDEEEIKEEEEEKEKKEKDKEKEKEIDPHYKLMLHYPECPNWWYGAILSISIVVGLIGIYAANSTLPWYGFLVSIAVSGIFIFFFGAQAALTGYQGNVQPIVQMLGGYLHPGRPLANMYFTLFGYNSVVQGISLVQELKFGQYAKIPPRVTFIAQAVGTLVGAMVNYAMMVQITTNQREILLSIQGTNVWSGQNIQQFNSQVSKPSSYC